MKTIDLFAGMGGAHLAGDYLGWDIIASVERNKAAQEVLRRHFPNMPVHDDVLTFKGSGLGAQLVTMGFPCKNISVAGKRQGLIKSEGDEGEVDDADPGEDDEGEEEEVTEETVRKSANESSLFFAGVRIGAEARAPLFIENVFNFLRNGLEHKGGDFYVALTHLQKMGYRNIRWTTNRASDVGAPHQRARVWLLAKYTGDVGFVGKWSKVLEGRSMEWPVKGMVTGDSLDVYQTNLPPLLYDDLWPTMRASDYKGVGPIGSKSHEHMKERDYLTAAIQDVTGISGNLNPLWCEPFMGWPVGWTAGEEGRWFAEEGMWPMRRGIYQYDWEAPRLIPKEGQPKKRIVITRAERIKALGNAWVPQQAVAAYRELTGAPGRIQGRLQLNLL